MLAVLRRLFSVRPAVDDHVLSVLAETKLFENLTLLDLERLAGETEAKTFPAESVIFRAGDPGDGLYVVDEGSVEIFLDTEQGPQSLAVLYDREYFGEMALIDDLGHRTASVRARVETRCLHVSRAGFERILASSHATASRILFHLCRVLSRRLAKTSRAAAGIVHVEPEKPAEATPIAAAAPPPPPPASNTAE
jgi:CRP/FNR family transcriptional regulator, cyclic AMP receptor protein